MQHRYIVTFPDTLGHLYVQEQTVLASPASPIDFWKRVVAWYGYQAVCGIARILAVLNIFLSGRRSYRLAKS